MTKIPSKPKKMTKIPSKPKNDQNTGYELAFKTFWVWTKALVSCEWSCPRVAQISPLMDFMGLIFSKFFYLSRATLSPPIPHTFFHSNPIKINCISFLLYLYEKLLHIPLILVLRFWNLGICVLFCDFHNSGWNT